MKKQNNKFAILDNYFVSLFGLQIVGLITLSYFKSEIASFFPSIFSDYNDAVIKVMAVSFTAISLVKVIQSFGIKKLLDKDLERKISGFTGVTILSLTLLVAANVFVLLGFVLDGSYIFLIVFFLLLVLQYAYRPTLQYFQKIYKVSNEELNKSSGL